MKTRLLSLMLVLLMTLTLIPFDALADNAAAESSCGSDGNNLTWVPDEENGVLTISGQGDMADYSEDAPAPWADCYDSVYIDTVRIEKGVTGIGEYAFSSCPASYVESASERVPLPKAIALPRSRRSLAA